MHTLEDEHRPQTYTARISALNYASYRNEIVGFLQVPTSTPIKLPAKFKSNYKQTLNSKR